jgi:homogentisate 1,2-dioxygenase
LHNCLSAHGPDAEGFERATNQDLKPERYEKTLAFMFETRFVIRPTKFAMETPSFQKDYFECWQGLKKHFTQ